MHSLCLWCTPWNAAGLSSLSGVPVDYFESLFLNDQSENKNLSPSIGEKESDEEDEDEEGLGNSYSENGGDFSEDSLDDLFSLEEEDQIEEFFDIDKLIGSCFFPYYNSGKENEYDYDNDIEEDGSIDLPSDSNDSPN